MILKRKDYYVIDILDDITDIVNNKAIKNITIEVYSIKPNREILKDYKRPIVMVDKYQKDVSKDELENLAWGVKERL